MVIKSNPYSDVTHYFPPPPVIPTLRKKPYDINKDPKFRKDMTIFFLKKIVKWMENYDAFKHTRKNLKKIKSKEGQNIIYKILREFVKKNEIKWFDLDNIYYDKVKDYLKFKLGTKIK